MEFSRSLDQCPASSALFRHEADGKFFIYIFDRSFNTSLELTRVVKKIIEFQDGVFTVLRTHVKDSFLISVV